MDGGKKKRFSGETIFKMVMFAVGLVSIGAMIFSFNVTWEQIRNTLFGS